MTDQASVPTSGNAPNGESEDRLPSLQPDEPERRLPFTARVAVKWYTAAELPHPEDGGFGYWRHAPMTGSVVTTDAGRDISFSDLEVT